MEKNYRVFVTEHNYAGMLGEDKGGKMVTNPCTGFHTKETAEGLAEFYARACPGNGKYPKSYEARCA